MANWVIVFPVIAIITGSVVGATITSRDRAILPGIMGVFSYFVLLAVAGALANVLIIATENFDTLHRILLAPVAFMIWTLVINGPCAMIAGVLAMVASYYADRRDTTEPRVVFRPRPALIQLAIGLFLAVTVFFWITRATLPSGL